MASRNYTQIINNNVYGQPSFTLELPTESFVDFDNAIFQDDDESVTSSFQKGSKKICKSSQEGSKKVMRKKHNKARNPWTPQEDVQLMELMKKHGQSWAMISAVMVGRTGKQIRDRYLNKLRPNIKCGDWSAQEDDLMIKLLKEIGNRWSLIATHLPGRTEGQVKNRYYSSIKKRLESNGELSQSSVSRTISESVSFANTPEAEETKFDFACEFDVNMMNGCATFNPEPVLNHQISNFLVSKPYAFEEEVSEESTTQSGNSQAQSPFLFAEAAPAFTYEPFLQSSDSFFLPPIENDTQVDDMLDKVTNYFMEQPTISSDVDSFFSDELKGDNTFSYDMESDKLANLSRRKAYLELALAKTLKEIKGL
jgi:hypothetical protein